VTVGVAFVQDTEPVDPYPAAMRKILNSTFMSLDGVINHMDRWHFDFIDEELEALALEQVRGSDGLLLGRHTYEVYATAWPGRDGELAERLNSMPKYLASTTLDTPSWSNTTVIEGDLVEAVTQLKQQDGKNILMHGYGPVAKTLMRNRLLDELCLWVHPVLAGAGTIDDMIWGQDVHARLDLEDVRTLASGIVVLTYRAGGSA
jgi:dihydrofolate reductase